LCAIASDLNSMMEHIRENGLTNDHTPWWIWIVLWGLLVLGTMIAQRIARSRSGLDEEEIAVVRRAAAEVRRGELIRASGASVLVALQLSPLLVPQGFRYYKHRAAANKVVDFDPRKQNRAEGVIFSFYELRITRTELIKGYNENAQRIPLQGLTAAVTTGQTVHITIEGPDTKCVYRKGFDAEFNLRRAQQFARPPEL
jgi:hypothetical protein